MPILSSSKTSASTNISDLRSVASAPGSVANPVSNLGKGSRSITSLGNAPVLDISGRNSTVTYSPTVTDYDAISRAITLADRAIENTANVGVGAVTAAQEAQALLASLAETKATDGENMRQKTNLFLIVSLAVVAAVIGWAALRK